MKTRTWIFILILSALICGAAGLFLIRPQEDSTQAQILSDGNLYKTVDLTIDQSFTVPAPGGGYNEISVQDGKIAVIDSSCPDHYCQKRGFRSGGPSIICLPNALEIRFLGTSGPDFVIE